MRVTNQITFTAKDDAEALRLAAERLGRDAVILSTQIIKEGGVLGMFKRSVLKVTAGILEDDNPKPVSKPKQANLPSSASSISNMDDDTRRENLIAFQRLMEFKDRGMSSATTPATTDRGMSDFRDRGMSPNTPTPIGDEGYGTDNIKISEQGLRNAYGLTSKPVNLNSQQQQAQRQQAISNDDAKILREQVGALADRLDLLLQRISAVENGVSNAINKNMNNFSGFAQVQPQVQNYSRNTDPDSIEARLRNSEVDEKYIRKLLADYSISIRKNKKLQFNKWLANQIPCSADGGNDPIGGRKIMLLGPTGVGKTTTIAQLAAIKALWEHKKVLLLTSDTYRIAAVEQLKTYAKILGVPIEIIFDINTIQQVVENHDNAEIILLDTAGRSQRDKKNMDLFENLFNAFIPDAVHLVLSANMKYNDMLDVVEHIPNIPVSHLLFTKLDETVSYGAIFNIQQVIGCPVSFLTVGQNVPKDIETATGSRIADFLLKPEQERKR